MAYLTYTEFQSYNTGADLTESEFDTLLFYSEMAIDSYLGRTLKSVDSTIKKAVAYQIAIAYKNGGTDYYSEIGASSQIASESLGDYSYSLTSATTTSTQSKFGITPIVANMLAPYCIRGVKVRL